MKPTKFQPQNKISAASPLNKASTTKPASSSPAKKDLAAQQI